MHPVLFEIPTPWGPQYIYSYGVMLGLSLIIGWHLVMYLGSRKDGLDKELMANCYLLGAVCSIVGARLLYVITNPGSFDSPVEWLNLRSGGLVAYGGFIGGFVGSALYLRAKKVPVLAFADAVAPALGTGLLFTRLGCYLYGCDFGGRLSEDAPAWLKTAGTFPRWEEYGDALRGSPAWAHHVQKYDLATDAAASYPVHPTQLYAAVAGIALFALTMWVWRNRRFRGQVFLVLTMAYGGWRFFVEYLRDDPERGSAFGFSTSQLISLMVIPVGAFAYMAVQKKVRERGEAPIPASARTAEPAEDEPLPASTRRVKGGKKKRRA